MEHPIWHLNVPAPFRDNWPGLGWADILKATVMQVVGVEMIDVFSCKGRLAAVDCT